jgi:hypothetical protein
LGKTTEILTSSFWRGRSVRVARHQVLAINLTSLRAPEGNGCAEHFIRTLKAQLLRVRRFRNVEESRVALREWLTKYNEKWLVERHSYRTPAQVRRDMLAAQVVAWLSAATVPENSVRLRNGATGNPRRGSDGSRLKFAPEKVPSPV